MSEDIYSISTSKLKQLNIFTTVKVLFEFISWFVKFWLLKLDILFSRHHVEQNYPKLYLKNICF